MAAVAVTPGFLRSEAMLEHFGVTEDNWRDGPRVQDALHRLGDPALRRPRGGAALAADPNVMERTGTVTSSWMLAREYGFTDVDGRRPDWGEYAVEHDLGITVE